MTASAKPPPLELETINREALAVANALAGRCREVSFEWDRRDSTLKFEMNPANRSVSWVVHAVLNGHDLQVGLTQLPEFSWMSPDLAGVRIEGLPPELATGVLQVCLESVTTKLIGQQIEFKILRVESHSGDWDLSPTSLGWTVKRGLRDGWMTGLLRGDAAGLEHLASLVAKVLPTPYRQRDEVPFAMDVVIGQTECASEVLRGLETNDILLGDFESFRKKGLCGLYAGSHKVAEGALEGVRLKLTDMPPRMEASEMDLAQPSAGDGESAGEDAAPSAVPVRLMFVLSRGVLPARQLSRLQAGQEFEIPANSLKEVSVLCGGSKIAEGELMEAGTRAGIRIRKLYPA